MRRSLCWLGRMKGRRRRGDAHRGGRLCLPNARSLLHRSLVYQHSPECKVVHLRLPLAAVVSRPVRRLHPQTPLGKVVARATALEKAEPGEQRLSYTTPVFQFLILNLCWVTKIMCGPRTGSSCGEVACTGCIPQPSLLHYLCWSDS